MRIDVVNFGQIVSIRIDDADEDEVPRLLGGRGANGRGGQRSGCGSAVTPAMVAAGLETFLAQGDRARLGATLAELWRAMEHVRARGGDLDEDR